MIDMTFGEKITHLLDRAGWTNAELARRCGVSKNTVGHWVNGERTPYQPVLLALSDVFGVSVNYLTDDAQDEPPAPVLSDDEREILRVVRASQLGYDEVVRRLTAGAPLPPGGPLPRPIVTEIDPRTGRPSVPIKPPSRDWDHGS